MRLPLATAAAGLLLGSACVEQDAAMFIEGALPAVEPNCEVNAQQVNFLAAGTLDLAAATGGYSGFLKVRTNLPSTFSNQDVQQDQSRSPNYRSYGPVDNNVVTFQRAELDLVLAADAATVDSLSLAAADVGADGQLDCNGGTCATNTANPEVVPAAGTVFNVQTTLNSASVVVAELISGTTARLLASMYRTAQFNEGLLEEDPNGEGAIALVLEGQPTTFNIKKDAENLSALNLLAVPSQRQRINVNIALVGETTGSVNLRPVKSSFFPFGIDLCFGCLEPSEAFCDMYDADLVANGNNCFPGQDFGVARCVCTGETATITGVCR